MPQKPKTPNTPPATATRETRKLEKLIRDSIRSELSAQQARTRATDVYTQRLHDTDAKMTEFIQQAINETTRAYRLSVDSFLIGYGAAFIILIVGLILAILTINKPDLFIIAILFIAMGVIWIINLQNRNLSKRNRSLVNNLAKLNIIFAGYIRQIHQVDALFEELRQSDSGIPFPIAEQLLNNLQDAMSEALSATSTVPDEWDE